MRTTAVDVVVVIGAGSMGQAIARRVGVATTILLADLNPDTATAAAHALQTAGYTVSTAHVDVAPTESVTRSRRHRRRPRVGASTCPHRRPVPGPSLPGGDHHRRPGRHRPRPGGSSAGHRPRRFRHRHRQPGRPHAAPATGRAEHRPSPPPPPRSSPSCRSCSPTPSPTPAPPTRWPSGPTSCASRPPASTWGDRGARLNSLSPGIIMTPLAMDELNGPGGEGYQR